MAPSKKKSTPINEKIKAEQVMLLEQMETKGLVSLTGMRSSLQEMNHWIWFRFLLLTLIPWFVNF